MWLGLILLGVCALLAYVLYKLHRPQHHELMTHFKGPPQLPVIGNLVPRDAVGIKVNFFMAMSRRLNPVVAGQTAFTKGLMADYGSGVTIKVLNEYVVFISSEKHMEAMLTSRDNITKGFPYDYIKPWFGDGLLTSTDGVWHRQRKLLTPTFHFKVLNDYVPVMNEAAEILSEKIDLICGKDAVDVCPLVTRCTLDIICETAMGRKIDAQNQESHPYLVSLMGFTDAAIARIPSPWHWNDTIYWSMPSGRRAHEYLKVLQDFTEQTIDEREQLLRDVDFESEESVSGKRRLSFMDLLLKMKAEGAITRREVQEQTDTFMFEGHDTTATGLQWFLYCMGRNQECQRRVQQEIDQVVGNGPVDQDACNKMKYLEMCIKEAQRMYPSVPVVARRCTKPLKLDEHHTVPPGVTVDLIIFDLHHNSRIYPDPEKFDPERFTPENIAKRHPFSYVPFSAGLRNCIGQKFAIMEEKIVAAHVLRKFNITAVQPESKMRYEFNFVLRPVDGIWCTFEQR